MITINNSIIYLLLMGSLVIPAVVSAGESKVKVGDPAPDFSLADQNGKERSLSNFRGQKVVLYFYPKDDTPGCTKEACSFRDNYHLYQTHNIAVLGVSYDSPQSHKKFAQKYNLPFILLSDTTKTVAKQYGAYRGLIRFLFPKRMTFLIDENGIVVHIFENVDVTTHAADVLEAFGIQALPKTNGENAEQE